MGLFAMLHLLCDLKFLSLFGLCLNLTVASVVMHISTARRPAGSPVYSPASAVVLTELGKLIISTLLAWREVGDLQRSEAAHGHAKHITGRRSEEQEESSRRLLAPPSSSSHSLSPPGSPYLASDDEDWRNAPPLPSPLTSVMSHQLRLPEDSPDTSLDMSYEAPSHTFKERLIRLREETLTPDIWALAIPAFLFTLQANAQYLASANLSVPVFQVTYQLKIPATAVCATLLLGRKIAFQQWMAIIALSVGVAVMQLAAMDPAVTSKIVESATAKSSDAHEISSHSDGHAANQMLGLAAVAFACMSSGFSGCYFEYRLKAEPTGGQKRKTGLWVRNIQLAGFGLAIAVGVSLSEFFGRTMANNSSRAGVGYFEHFFIGFTPITFAVVALQINGGLLSALAIMYSDNVAKAFSASASIVSSFAASMWLFQYHLTLPAAIGAAMVIAATCVYGSKPKSLQPVRLMASPLTDKHNFTPVSTSSEK